MKELTKLIKIFEYVAFNFIVIPLAYFFNVFIHAVGGNSLKVVFDENPPDNSFLTISLAIFFILVGKFYFLEIARDVKARKNGSSKKSVITRLRDVTLNVANHKFSTSNIRVFSRIRGLTGFLTPYSQARIRHKPLRYLFRFSWTFSCFPCGRPSFIVFSE